MMAAPPGLAATTFSPIKTNAVAGLPFSSAGRKQNKPPGAPAGACTEEQPQTCTAYEPLAMHLQILYLSASDQDSK